MSGDCFSRASPVISFREFKECGSKVFLIENVLKNQRISGYQIFCR